MMEALIYIANGLYLLSYFVQDMLRLRILTIIAATTLVSYFYLQPVPMMTVVYWNLFFIGLNAMQLCRILFPTWSTKLRKRQVSSEADAAGPGGWKNRGRKLPGRCRPVSLRGKDSILRNRKITGELGVQGYRFRSR